MIYKGRGIPVFLAACFATMGLLGASSVHAQSTSAIVVAACGNQTLPVSSNRAVSQDTTGTLCTSGGGAAAVTVQGNVSNAADAVATTSTNVPNVSYNYGFNGTTWDRLQVDASKFLKSDVTGNVASGGTDSGNPIKIGGVYNTTPPTLSNAQRGDAQLDVNGNLRAAIEGIASSGTDAISNNAVTYIGRGNAASTNGILAASVSLFNGTTFDRQRSIQGVSATGIGTTAVAEAPNAQLGSSGGTPVTGQTVTSIVAKASTGNLYGFNVVSGTTAGFIVVNNTTAAPGGGGATTPIYCVPLAASSGYTWRSDIPINGAVGLVILFSTSCGTYTAVSPAATFMQSEAQ